MSGFFKNATAYAGSNLIGQACKVGQEFLLRRLLSPEFLGIWNLANVVQGFAGTFDLGIGAAAEREIALFQGAAKSDEALEARSTAFWSQLAQSALFAVGIVGYVLILRRKETPLVIAGYVAGALLVLATGVTGMLMLFHSASLRYVALSRVLLASSLLSAVLLPIGAYLGGAWGLLTAGLLGNALQGILIGVSARLQGLGIRRLWHPTVFRRLLAYGLPLRVADYPLALFSVVDGMFVARFLGLEALALYSTAKVVLIQATDIPARLASVLVMRLYSQAGASRSRADLANDLMRFLTFSYLALIPLIILGVSLAASLAFTQFLPKYTPSLPVMYKLLFAMYFVPNTSIVRNFWMLDARLVALGVANAVGFLGLICIGLAILETNGWSLSSVALSMVAGYAFFFSCLMATIGREIWGWRRTLKLCCAVAVSFLYTALVLRLITTQSVAATTLPGALALFGVSLTKGVLLLSPMLLFAVWRTRLLLYLPVR